MLTYQSVPRQDSGTHDQDDSTDRRKISVSPASRLMLAHDLVGEPSKLNTKGMSQLWLLMIIKDSNSSRNRELPL